MKIYEETLENFAPEYPLENLTNPERILFLDIETTGFTARSSYLYLIGCAYLKSGKWCTIQWLAENYEQEEEILNAFLEFSKPYEYLIHFNGNNFDLPFLSQKCRQYELSDTLGKFSGVDLYKRIAPYKYFLRLPNCKQKTLEQYLGKTRKDVFSGGELIGIYHDYVNNPSDLSENSLFLHNVDDIKGMLNILPMLAYYDMFNGTVKAKKVQANTYSDPSGNKRKELLITVALPTKLPKTVSSNANYCFVRAEGSEATLRVPIYEEELKYFYANYRDYYYLPMEDVALHKSVSGFVDSDHRVPATPATCYTRKQSCYLPQWEIKFEPFFKREYRSKEVFFELTDELKRDRTAFTAYAGHVLQMIAATY